MICVLLTTGTWYAFAQTTVTVTGKITDEQGEALPGANVTVKGSIQGTVSDFNGNYSIQAPSGATLVYSFIGYKPVEQTVDDRRKIDVTLAEDTQQIEEVVVVGYGVQRKSDVTGSVISVSSSELTTKPVMNALDALQGKVAGVDITQNQRPGELGSITIRGKRSLVDNGNDPLYVVDGIVLSSGGIETINPRDIEGISILKDASSTAIYGSRGANGVVLVTTKRGKEGRFQVSYAGTVTLEKIRDLSPAMSASDFITWRRWGFYNANPTTAVPGNQPTKEQDAVIFSALDTDSYNNVMKGWASGSWDGSKVTNTDWTDFVTQTGITQEHTLSASGGTEKMKSFFSFGYLKNDGTQKGQEYERYNATMSTDITPTKWFSMGGSINASFGFQSYGYSRTAQATNSGPTDIYNAAKQIMNLTVPYNSNGDIILTPGNVNGVYTVVDEWKKSDERRQTFRALGSFYANINFGGILKQLNGLNFKTNFGPDYRYYRRGIYIDSSSAVRQGRNNYAYWNNEQRFSWVLDNMLTYNKTIDSHRFDITALQSASKYQEETAFLKAENLAKASFKWNNMGSVDITNAAYNASMGTGITESQLASYMVRLNYSFMDRYLLTASGRYDGSSVLSEGHKWDFFPSVALGWRIDQENFMENANWLDQLKLRLGMGVTGNSTVKPYATLGNIRSFYVPFTGSGNVLAYGTNEPYYFATAELMANPGLGWEKTTQWNLGVDFGMLRGRISGSVDFYKSDTKDLLMQMSISSLTGYSATMANVGKSKNKGIDISLSVIPVKIKDFTWYSTVNTAWHKEELVELANGKNDMVDNTWFIGQSISVYYGYDNDGLWQESDATEMQKFNDKGAKFQVGMVKPVDQDGDYLINANDRVIIGNRDPRWTLGWSNTFNYKGIELNIELYGRMGYTVSTGGEGQGGLYNQRKIDYWRPDNTGADWQKPIYTGTPGVSGDEYASLIGFKKAAYLKFRNISLGYFLPEKYTKPLGMSSLKVFAQLRNPGCLFSTVDFIDLDFDASYYNRGITFGLEVAF